MEFTRSDLQAGWNSAGAMMLLDCFPAICQLTILQKTPLILAPSLSNLPPPPTRKSTTPSSHTPTPLSPFFPTQPTSTPSLPIARSRPHPTQQSLLRDLKGHQWRMLRGLQCHDGGSSALKDGLGGCWLGYAVVLFDSGERVERRGVGRPEGRRRRYGVWEWGAI